MYSLLVVFSLQLKARCPTPTPHWVYQPPTCTTPVLKVQLSNCCVTREALLCTPKMSWRTAGFSHPTVTSTVQGGRAQGILSLAIRMATTACRQDCILALQSKTSGYFCRTLPMLTRVATAAWSSTSRWNINMAPLCRNLIATLFFKWHHVRTSYVWLWMRGKLVHSKMTRVKLKPLWRSQCN